jgi:threonyl-tRNA synthetase
MSGPEADRQDQLERIRHSCAHILAQATSELFPGTRLWVGPPIDHGFYYDMDVPGGISDTDLPKIQKRMKKIVGRNHAFERQVLSREDAYARWDGDPYKTALIDGVPEDEEVSCVSHGDFTDLCRGHHTERTLECKHFRLTKVAGAYWRGDEKHPMLTRVYGIAFDTGEALTEHVRMLEEAAKRDHRKLGRELGLFLTTDEVGPGLILWQPRGARIRQIIERYVGDLLLERGYDPVFTPHVARHQLWQTSGHADFFAEGMFSPMDVDGQDYQLKPMNCPFHIQVYASTRRTYRELPMRLSELGTVYRYERSGVLHGTLRVRGFTQDDAHIFCTRDQATEEVVACLNLTAEILDAFGFTDRRAFLSTRPEKMAGAAEDWDLAEGALGAALESLGWQYEMDEGGGAFYGPKIDVKVRDAIGREWQLSTIQFDFNLPERFDLAYVAADGANHRPMMVHRAILGSVERFFGVLVEHYAGAFPVWLAPEQIRLLPVSERFLEGAAELAARLRAGGVRATVDERDEKLGAKIRRGSKEKLPYLGVVGEQELADGTIAIRRLGQGDLGSLGVDDVISRIAGEAAEKAI